VPIAKDADYVSNQGVRMSNVIEFLEKVGQDAQLNCATKGSLDFAPMLADFDPMLQRAICGGDRATLGALLGIAPVCGFLAPGEEQEEDDSEETPSPDDEERSVSDLAD
jgi:hypothetical protein